MNIEYAGRAGAALYTDLVMIDDELIGTSRYGGAIESWTSDLTPIDSLAHTRGDTAGGEAELTVVNFSDGPALLTGGGANGSLQLISVTDGTLSAVIDYGEFSWPSDITSSAAVTLASGRIGFTVASGVRQASQGSNSLETAHSSARVIRLTRRSPLQQGSPR